MLQQCKDAIGICKVLLRNGYDAHIINAPLQAKLLEKSKVSRIDIACEPNSDVLVKLFPNAVAVEGKRFIATLTEGDITYHFFPLQVEDATHPELSLLRITPHMLESIDFDKRRQLRISRFGAPANFENDVYEGFEHIKCGTIRLLGLPDETLHHNYVLAIRALRFAANFDLPIDPNTWLAIVRANTHVLDYVPMSKIMDEWRKVAAECMWKFIQLLYDAHILQGLIPEIASLSCIKQHKNKDGDIETVFDHTLACVKAYPEEEFHYDWLGTVAMLFHDVGKLYTAEFFNDTWTFYQHHRVGAQVTRRILRRLHFLTEDIDLVCHLVRYHMRFHFMLTDRGVRRFKALDEYPRLMEMTRADIKARQGNYTYFNHNMKYLDRAETPEQMLEPLLNGNEIMTHTNLSPGPMIGILRDALLQAQIVGDVETVDAAIAFVKDYVEKA